jgi:nucleotide-binding universal stress UspA family protein
MIKSILLPIDGSAYTDSVISYGQFLSQKFNAVLRLLSVVDIRLYDWSVATNADNFVPIMPPTGFQAESQKLHDEKTDQVLEKAGELCKKKKNKYELIKVAGIPVEEICSHAKLSDMVIMGIRGEYERWSGKLLGDTVESVTRQISKPTMLVEKEFTPFKSILCGYDGSTQANKALQFAANIAHYLKTKLQVITVMDNEEERKSVLNEAEKYLAPYEIDFQLRHEFGDPEEILINASKNTAVESLLIIGCYGHSRIREAILGSTTVHVMRNAHKPLLLAK